MTKPRIALSLILLPLTLGWLHARRSDAATGQEDQPAQSEAPPRGMPRIDPPDGDFAGVIRERLDAGSYTYLLVTTADGRERWVVTLGEGAPVGSNVDIVNMGLRHDFRSRRLARTFDRLVFAIVRERG